MGLFLLSCATLLLEVALTRLFSVSLWYHFTFMVLSLAMLGFGASGTVLSLKPSLARGKHDVLFLASLLFSLSTVASLTIAHGVPFDPLYLGDKPIHAAYMLLYFFFFFVPFFMNGLVTAACFKKNPQQPHLLYFLVMTGSAVGCLAAAFLLSRAGQTRCVLFSALLGTCAAFCFAWNVKNVPQKILSVAAMAVFFLLFMKPFPFFEPHIAESKFMGRLKSQFNTHPVSTRWNSFSQIDAFEGEWVIYPPFLAGKNVNVPPQIALLIDGDAFTPITKFDGNIKKLSFLKQLPTTPVYFIKKNANACIIGSGGGIDVLSALYGGAKHVTAVEINPLIVDLTKNRYGKFSGNIYGNPKVDVVIENGRTFMRRTKEKFDVIQMSLVDTWAASSSGALSLTENYLYTVEAFQEYLDHLTDDGMISVTRWYTDPPLEILRLESVAIEALTRKNVHNPSAHFLIFSKENLATVLIRKKPLSYRDYENYQIQFENRKFNFHDPMLKNGIQINRTDPIGVTQLDPLNPDINMDSLSPFYKKEHNARITPVTDDSPFFFYFSSSLFPRRLKNTNALLEKNTMGSLALLLSLIFTSVISFVLIFLPSRASAKIAEDTLPQKRIIFIYFFAIGCGYMFFEMVLLQKLALFLGNPTVSFITAVSGLLFSSGVGSLWASSAVRKNIFSRCLAVLCVFLLMDVLFLTTLMNVFQGAPFPMRIVISFAILFPQGFLLGIPFPSGLSSIGCLQKELIPWAWSINAFASVIAPVAATLIAIHKGFSMVMWLCLLCYLLLFVFRINDEKT